MEKNIDKVRCPMSIGDSHYKFIFEKSTDAILIIENSRFIDCNEAALKMFGLDKKEQLIGFNPLEISPIYQPCGKKSVDKGKDMFRKALKNGSHIFEWEHIYKKTEVTFFAEILLIALKTEGNNMFYALVRNITERKREMGQLEERENLYRGFFHNSDVVMLLFDPVSDDIIDVNQAACNFYGYDKVTMKSMKVSDINVMDKAEIYNEVQRAKNEGRKYYHFKHQLANGRVIDVEVYRGNIHVHGKYLRYAIIYDITDRKRFEEELRLQKSMFQQLFENCPEAMVMLDSKDRVMNINHSFEKTFQYSLEEVMGQNIKEIIVPEELSNEADLWSQEIISGGFIKKESKRKCKDGSLIDVDILGYPVVDNDHQRGIYGIYKDISTRKEFERKLTLFAKVLENNTEGVIIIDKHGKIQWVNRAFTTITGYTRSEVSNLNPSILKSLRHNDSHYKDMWKNILEKGKWQGEIWNRRKNGEVYPQWLNIFSIKENDVATHYAAIIRDITESKQREEKINYLAFRDCLTGLYNRTMFNERLNQVLAAAKRKEQFIGLLFMDMDGFKNINDTLGHRAGDQLLQLIADKLLSNTRESDTVARIGGDEFIILLPEVDEITQISKVAKKITRIFRKPWEVEDHVFNITASIGVSVYPNDGVDPEELIKKADSAMYKAKDEGKNQYRFYSFENL
ncbi:PAS domain S-box protein [Alkaliphilus peptidifermentans]|uniref:PAS domain S-box-containing protein/diguanylate cyclase (GGDEF) domain-containing protein n=1 Tax=Alkaliphilus peptidifermentans DSM 18978 TaxID=1120976 RepID=A0A1G5LDU7_9FIRM|nr:PAS domain S-box protein [Alkaliphilus peptidifermentans]SCZ10478.1 PAS domain S-box-containing protein/diguanylate cyclase (GGDEF) domain-containing protein [Alkaliphilus peptidifermentans DSM 18978]